MKRFLSLNYLYYFLVGFPSLINQAIDRAILPIGRTIGVTNAIGLAGIHAPSTTLNRGDVA
ncbi:MAG: hypothetical protein AB2765_19170, partial [Candidatus Thiodiazotropha endolucinida]